jgi:hypothetical protein
VTSKGVPVDVTPPRAEEALAVVRARTFIALSVASRVLEFADPTSPLANDPHAWAKVGRELKYLELEVLHTAVMRMSGVPWETLAAKQEVPRQSLHRRLAEKVRIQARVAQQDSAQERIDTLLDDILTHASKLKASVEADCSEAANEVVARSESYRWWESARRG